MMLHAIVKVAIATPSTLLVTYEDGKQIEFSVSPLIDQGGIFKALADQDYFGQVAIGQRGRFLTWPGELEICADAIRLGVPQAVTS